jgi:hypothetical protein
MRTALLLTAILISACGKAPSLKQENRLVGTRWENAEMIGSLITMEFTDATTGYLQTGAAEQVFSYRLKGDAIETDLHGDSNGYKSCAFSLTESSLTFNCGNRDVTYSRVGSN